MEHITRKTYGYLINILLDEMSEEMTSSYRLWYKGKLEDNDRELAEAYKHLSRDARACADSLAAILIHEGRLTEEEYQKTRRTAQEEAKKKLNID